MGIEIPAEDEPQRAPDVGPKRACGDISTGYYILMCTVICMCMCVYVYMYMYTYMYTYLYVYMCMYLYRYMYIYMCIYMYTIRTASSLPRSVAVSARESEPCFMYCVVVVCIYVLYN